MRECQSLSSFSHLRICRDDTRSPPIGLLGADGLLFETQELIASPGNLTPSGTRRPCSGEKWFTIARLSRKGPCRGIQPRTHRGSLRKGRELRGKGTSGCHFWRARNTYFRSGGVPVPKVCLLDIRELPRRVKRERRGIRLMVTDHPLLSVSDPLPQPVGDRLGFWPLA